MNVWLLTTSGRLQMATMQFLSIYPNAKNGDVVYLKTARQKETLETNFKLNLCVVFAGNVSFTVSVFMKARSRGAQTPFFLPFICVSEKQRALHGFAQQRLAEAESKPTKLTVNPTELDLQAQTHRRMTGGDRQYLKCTNYSRSVCTTCTVSTLELQCQHVQPAESQRAVSC